MYFWYSPIESNYVCRLIRPVLNTVEDELHMVGTGGFEPTCLAIISRVLIHMSLIPLWRRKRDSNPRAGSSPTWCFSRALPYDHLGIPPY